MHAVLDGSVIRTPLSGVQLSVRLELVSLFGALRPGEATVLCRDPEVLRAAREHGIPAPPVPGAVRRVAYRVFWQQVVLPGLLRKLGADVFHGFAYTAPLRCGVPMAVNVHDVIALEHPELCDRLNVLHMRAFMPRALRRASALIVSTHHVAERVRAVAGTSAERIHVVPLGVDSVRFSPGRDRPSGETGGRPRVLFVGNIEPKKGIDVLLDAWEGASLHERAELVIGGRPAWRSGGTMERVRRGVSSGILRYEGRVPDDRLPDMYREAGVFVFPSREEGFGMPVLEAMGCGTPVVHSDHPAVMEAAGGAGRAFRSGDPESLAAALIEVLDSASLSRELAERGRARALAARWELWGEAASGILRGCS